MGTRIGLHARHRHRLRVPKMATVPWLMPWQIARRSWICHVRDGHLLFISILWTIGSIAGLGMTLPWRVVSRKRPSLGPLRQHRLIWRDKCGGGLSWRRGVAVTAAVAAARPAGARLEWARHWRRLGRFRQLMVLATHSSSHEPSRFSRAPKRGKTRAKSASSRRVAAHARGAQTAMFRTGRDHAFGTCTAHAAVVRVLTSARCRAALLFLLQLPKKGW